MKLRFLLFAAISGILVAGSLESVQSDDLIVLGKGHAPIYVSNSDSGRFDFNNDGLADYYVKAHYTGNEHQRYKIDYKIQDECVDGETFDNAKLKLGFTNAERFFFDRVWLVDGISVWNPWFNAKNNDADGLVNLVYLPAGTLPIPYPAEGNGDDLIQGSEKKKSGSFVHKDSIEELDSQSGWQGSVFFKAPAGEYFLWTIHPATGLGGCDTLSAFGIPIIIEN